MRPPRGRLKRRDPFGQGAQSSNGVGKLPSILSSNGNSKRPVLITGGAGFIGTNLADRLLCLGRPVIAFDNLSRHGSEINLEWLSRKHGSRLRVETGDVCDYDALRRVTREAAAVFHLAAQVAVTDSVVDPRKDFEVNAGGTLNVLEAIREVPVPPPLVFTSTNKVYGALPDLKLRKSNDGYRPVDVRTAEQGISERRSLDFCSPYGCSKGAADQYVIDYARTFQVCTTVFRMSCIYGPHQFGTEDQGWIAHFLLRAREGQTITIYGDGSQVRDVLFVDDLIDAFVRALESMEAIRGRVFNIGGGPGNTLSLLQLIRQITELQGSPCPVQFGEWRQGDQRYYVSNASEFTRATGWMPKVAVHEGVAQLYRWFEESDGFRARGASRNNQNEIGFPRNGSRDAAEHSFLRSS